MCDFPDVVFEFSTDIFSEPLFRVFDSIWMSQILSIASQACHSTSLVVFRIKIQIIHCSVDSFKKLLVSEASIGHRIGTLGSLPSIRIGRISLNTYMIPSPEDPFSTAFNASTASTIGSEDHFFLSMATGPSRPSIVNIGSEALAS